MRPGTTYNNSGKSSYANFEIGPELNKRYVQVVKQQVKMHQEDLHEILVKLHIKFIRYGATAQKIRAKQVKHDIDAKCIETSSKHLKTRMQHDKMKLHAISSKFHIEHTQNGATVQHIHYTRYNNNLSKTAIRHLASIKTICYNITM